MKNLFLFVISTTFVISSLAAPQPLIDAQNILSMPIEGGRHLPISGANTNDHVYTAAITDYLRYFYLVDVQIGTPPISYRAILDNGWQDLFIPSVNCVDDWCRLRQRYDAAKSSTYTPIGYPVNLDYAGFHTRGHASADTVHVAGMSVQRQIFQEATSYLDSPFVPDYAFDTSLGLSRLLYRHPDSSLHAPSIWHNIIQQNLLRRNIFSIKLSRSPDQNGEIMVGGLNHDLFQGELMTFPITHVDADYPPDNENPFGGLQFKNGWQIAVNSIAIGPLEVDLSGYVAVIMTSFPYLDLTPEISDAIWSLCGDREPGDYSDIIDCELRETLPSLTFRFGETGSGSVTISPYDYVSEVYYPPEDETYCVLHLYGHALRDDVPRNVILGSPFLAGVYAVFDQDEETISFAQL